MYWSSDVYSTQRSQSLGKQSMKRKTNSTEHSNDSLLYEGKNQLSHESLAEKVQKFLLVNKKHEFDEVCVCQDCIYAKQLQQYQALQMDLSKNSSYRIQYNKNHLKKNLNINQNLKDSSRSNKTQEAKISKVPYVHLDSVYNNQYSLRSVGKVQKPHPIDELKFTGPLNGFSSYKQMYSNIHGPYQYVQPIKERSIPSLKFNSESLYSNSYKGQKGVQTESAKMNDQLRLGKPFIVTQSTQKSQFVDPQNLYHKYNRYNTSRQRKIQTPNFSYQYKTINRDQFEKPASKKNCRNKRMQLLHGKMLSSQKFSTIL